MVASDGGVFAYGDAKFFGSAAEYATAPVVALTPTLSGAGYWLTTADGNMYAYGDAVYYGAI